MKQIVITIILLTNISLIGQVRNFDEISKNILEQLNKMGVDNSPLLNSYESAYFNVIFEKSRKNFVQMQLTNATFRGESKNKNFFRRKRQG